MPWYAPYNFQDWVIPSNAVRGFLQLLCIRREMPWVKWRKEYRLTFRHGVLYFWSTVQGIMTPAVRKSKMAAHWSKFAPSLLRCKVESIKLQHLPSVRDFAFNWLWMSFHILNLVLSILFLGRAPGSVGHSSCHSRRPWQGAPQNVMPL